MMIDSTVPARFAAQAIVTGAVAFLAGCATSFGPSIQPYEKPQRSAENLVVQWGEETWAAARNGEKNVVLGLLRTPPAASDAKTADLIDAFDVDVATAADVRATRAREELATLASHSIDDDEWLSAITSLADLWNVGVTPSSLSDEIEHAVRKGLDTLEDHARDAESNNNFERATIDWGVVSTVTEAIGASQRHHAARKHIITASEPITWKASGEPSVFDFLTTNAVDVQDCIQVIENILERHVEPRTWLELCIPGFENMLRRASFSVDDNAAMKQRITDALETLTTSGSSTICSTRVLCSPARTLLRQALNDALATGDSSALPTPSNLSRAFINGVFASLDIHSSMIWPEHVASLRRTLGDAYVGIGAQVGMTAEGTPELAPMPGSPARQAGVQDGDRLIAIDGWSTHERTLDEGVQRVIGQLGTTVTLTLQRDDNPDPFDLIVTRGAIIRPAILGWSQDGVSQRGGPVWQWLVNPSLGIAYIKIADFTDDTEPQFRRAINAARAAMPNGVALAGLILDLRENGGGTKQSATRLADLFLNFGAVCATQQSDGRIRTERASTRTSRLSGIPLVILINERSASASELLAGALQGTGDAVVVGERSYGKGSAQSVFSFQLGLIKLTTDWFAVPTQTGIRFIDRSRSPETWGVRPNLEVRAANNHDRAIRSARGQWYAHRGEDVPPERSATALEVIDSDDRALILGLAVLEARVAREPTQ